MQWRYHVAGNFDLLCIDCGVVVGNTYDKYVPIRCKKCMDKRKEKGSGSGESPTV